MSFAHPLGLLGLLLVPAVLALHYFRRRLPRRNVAGLFLFAAHGTATSGGRKRSRLQRTASLVLELLAALLLGLWLGGPRLGWTDTATHVVVVVDDSASMSARAGPLARSALGPAGGLADDATIAELVVARVAALFAALPDGALVTVLRSGPRPEIVAGPRVPLAGARNALAGWAPWRPHHELGPTLDLAVELSGVEDALWLFTDRTDEPAPPRVTVVGLGEPRPNVALLSAGRRVAAASAPEPDRGGADERVFCDVVAFADEPVKTRLRVSIANDVDAPALAERELDVSPERPLRVAFDLPAAARDAALVLRLGGDDALAVDDRFVLLPESVRRIRIASRLGDERDALADLSRVVDSIAGADLVGAEDPAELVVLDRSAFATLGDGGSRSPRAVVVGPCTAADGPSDAASDAWLGPFLLARGDRLVDGITLDGVVWGAGAADAAGDPLVSIGERVLLGAERGVDGRLAVVHANLDLERTNLTSSPDWPILWANVVGAVRDALPGRARANVLVGNLLVWRRGPEAAAAGGAAGQPWRLVDPRGVERIARGRARFTFEARRPGLHALVDGAGEVVGRWSVNFADPRESDLRTRSVGERAATADAAPSGSRADGDVAESGRIEERVLALLLLLAVVGDWFVLRRVPGGRP